MISIHDIKGVLVTIGIVLVFSYGGFYIIHRIFRREFLRIYRYSLSLITGGRYTIHKFNWIGTFFLLC